MIAPLLTLLTAAALCLLLGVFTRTARLSAPVAAGGASLSLVLWLVVSLPASAADPIGWPSGLTWLGPAPFGSDALSDLLGGWCLLLGAFFTLKVGSRGGSPAQLAVALLTLATLYCITHTVGLFVFSIEVLLLVLLAWGFYFLSGEQDARTDRSVLSLGLGAICLLAAALLVGRTTGGAYDLRALSLSAFTVWPLALLAAFALVWSGMLPLVGWSALVPRGGYGAMLHALVLGVPPVTLMMRLQSLVTNEAVGATVPGGWGGLMQVLAWAGGATALVASAGMVVWLGKSRWPAMQAAFWLGLALWALGLDTPLARVAALVLFMAYGAGRAAQELLQGEVGRGATLLRGFASASLAGAPLTPGFLGVWLLGVAVAGEARASWVVVLLAALALVWCGTALHVSVMGADAPGPRHEGLAGWVLGVALVLAVLLVPFWVPLVAQAASVAGGATASSIVDTWWGGLVPDGMALPVVLLTSGALLIGLVGWLIAGAARSGTANSSTLLPSALERLSTSAEESATRPDMSALLENSPGPVWWLSFAWLDRGVWGFGSLIQRLVAGLGDLFGRLEGRFYLPLALILTLAALLAVTR